MNEDLNPSQTPGDARGTPDEALAAEFEQMLREHGSGAKPNPSAQPVFAWGQCPEPGDWALLLDEDPRPEDLHKVNVLLTHAAGCGDCAQALRSLSAEITPEETAALAEVASVSPDGQRKLAARLAATPTHRTNQRSIRSYIWVGAALAASLLMAAGLTTYSRITNNPDRLLAQAYTQDRIFDLRMPGAAYADVTPRVHLRGGSAVHEAAKLKDAETRIEHQLSLAPHDAPTLELEARADVLQEKFDPAIDILDRLIAQGPVTATLLLDDASAYFQRGLATASDSDRATALQILRQADELAPGDTVVMFNEAVAMEDCGELMNAVETWDRYLRFERDPQWQSEGRRRLQALEQKLAQLKSKPVK